jgi:hypothetical protein
MLKNNKASKLSATISGLSIFDKLNLLIVFAFFIGVLLFPISYITPIAGESQTQVIKII